MELAPVTLFKGKERAEARPAISHFLLSRAIAPSTFHIFISYSDRFAEIRRITPISKLVERPQIDDTESRKMIWQALFPTAPMPKVREHALEECCGLLDKFLPENVPIDKIIQRVKHG
mgnify:CR=1 FL=1